MSFVCCRKFPQGSGLANRMPGYVEITCTEARMLRSWSAADFQRAVATLNAAARRVESRTLTKSAFAEIQQMVGLRHNPVGLVADVELCGLVQPLDVMRFDWVHSMLQGGVVNAEVEALVQATGITHEELQTFLRDAAWQYPQWRRQKSKELHRVFDERRCSKEDAFKVHASCSELLGLYGMLRFFVELKLGAVPETTEHLESLNKMCDVMDMLLAIKRCTVNVAQGTAQLEADVAEHIRLHVAAYGAGHVKPKHHWMMDVPGQIRSDGILVDAFVIERIHLRVKCIAENVRNTTSFEGSVLESVLTAHFEELGSRQFGDCLLGRSAVLPGFLGARVADGMRNFGIEFRIGDVAMCGDEVTKVEACAQDGDGLFAFVRLLAKVRDVTDHVASYQVGADLVVREASRLLHALAWRASDNSTVLVVRR